MPIKKTKSTKSKKLTKAKANRVGRPSKYSSVDLEKIKLMAGFGLINDQIAEMLGVNIYVRSIPQGVPQGVWTLGSDQGATITNPQFKVDARVDVQAGQGETRLQLGDWTEAVYTEPDGRCFYHAVVGCLGERNRVELPPLAAPKFAAEIIRHVKLPALVPR